MHEQLGEQQPAEREKHLTPAFVAFSALRDLTMRPALAGHLAGFHYDGASQYAPYLGALCSPAETTSCSEITAPSGAASA